jgi:hypothetical protein
MDYENTIHYILPQIKTFTLYIYLKINIQTTKLFNIIQQPTLTIF